MPYNPPLIQLQALRVVKRWQLGVRPTQIAGKAVGKAFKSLKFEVVTERLIAAEVLSSRGDTKSDFWSEFGGAISELCLRGFLLKHDHCGKCTFAPLEFFSEGGVPFLIDDEDFSSIRFQANGWMRGVMGGKNQAGYQITPLGFRLLDEHEGTDKLVPTTVVIRDYYVSRATLLRYIKTGKLTDRRSPGHAKNASHVFDRRELDQHLARKKT